MKKNNYYHFCHFLVLFFNDSVFENGHGILLDQSLNMLSQLILVIKKMHKACMHSNKRMQF